MQELKNKNEKGAGVWYLVSMSGTRAVNRFCIKWALQMWRRLMLLIALKSVSAAPLPTTEVKHPFFFFFFFKMPLIGRKASELGSNLICLPWYIGALCWTPPAVRLELDLKPFSDSEVAWERQALLLVYLLNERTGCSFFYLRISLHAKIQWIILTDFVCFNFTELWRGNSDNLNMQLWLLPSSAIWAFPF